MICDILIKNAKTRKLDDLVNIAVKDGKIAAIEKGLEAEAKQVIDAAGCLVTESFVNGHLHLDKVYTLKMAGEDALKSYTGGGMGGAMTSIEQAANFKAAYDESWLIGNVRKACDLAVKYGNKACRACRIFPICHGGCSQTKLEAGDREDCLFGLDDERRLEIIRGRLDFILKTKRTSY